VKERRREEEKKLIQGVLSSKICREKTALLYELETNLWGCAMLTRPS
jgi:hypothetical protein